MTTIPNGDYRFDDGQDVHVYGEPGTRFTTNQVYGSQPPELDAHGRKTIALYTEDGNLFVIGKGHVWNSRENTMTPLSGFPFHVTLDNENVRFRVPTAEEDSVKGMSTGSPVFLAIERVDDALVPSDPQPLIGQNPLPRFDAALARHQATVTRSYGDGTVTRRLSQAGDNIIVHQPDKTSVLVPDDQDAVIATSESGRDYAIYKGYLVDMTTGNVQPMQQESVVVSVGSYIDVPGLNGSVKVSAITVPTDPQSPDAARAQHVHGLSPFENVRELVNRHIFEAHRNAGNRGANPHDATSAAQNASRPAGGSTDMFGR